MYFYFLSRKSEMNRFKFKSLSFLMALLVLIAFVYIIKITLPAPLGRNQKEYRNNIPRPTYFNNPTGQITTVLKLKGERYLEYHNNNRGREQATNSLQLQNISECLCSRRWMYPPTADSNRMGGSIDTKSYFKILNSSCSDEGTHYQTNQNVISFSLRYPSNSEITTTRVSPLNFRTGLLQNLLMKRLHYPGYSLRVYTSVHLRPRGHFCHLLCQNEDLFWCDIKKTPVYGDLSPMNFRTWRFLPLGDPTVNIFHSRDLDSLINLREAAAVQDWLSNSGKNRKAIIIMRDRDEGHNLPILAGMWGADNSKLLEVESSKEIDFLRERVIFSSQQTSAQYQSYDQDLLSAVIFYPRAKNILAYDSYNCVKWSKFTEVRPFPTRQDKPYTEFVGNRVDFTWGNVRKWTYGTAECPLECRPSYGLNWTFC